MDSAVQGPRPAPDGSQAGRPGAVSTSARLRRYDAFLDLRRRVLPAAAAAQPDDGRAKPAGPGTRRRTDLRLVLPALAAWGAAVAGLWLPPLALGFACCLLLAASAALLAGHRYGRRTVRTVRTVRPVGRGGRSFPATAAVALALAATVAAHAAVAAGQRTDGPLADAVAAGKSVVALVEVAATPKALNLAGHSSGPQRWAVPVWTVEISTGGVLVRTRAQLLVMGGGAWGAAVPGQQLRAAGKLRAPGPGSLETGILAASAAPATMSDGAGLNAAAADLRARFVAACRFLGPDASGLLPGLVTGDTSVLDEDLMVAMKSVGMTHLTAVSGANCSLVLGGLLLAARRFRLPRVPAAGVALGGLGLFVVLVGPEASVLRAAVMGGVAVAALACGRSGRGLSFLCLAVIGLLLLDPGLGGSFGFLLSVLATLGIIVLGRRLIEWTPAAVPRWMAAAVAVPLSAQLLCGPVTVLLQPGFSTYSLLANVLAAPLVAPVTLLGTAAVPMLAVAEWWAVPLIAGAGLFSAGVAAIARFATALPAATVPWAEGIPGVLSMALLSALTFGAVWASVRPRRTARKILACHRHTERLLAQLETWGRTGPARFPGRRRLAGRQGHGRVGNSTKLSGRNPRWPLHKNGHPAHRQPTWPRGGT